MDVLLSPPPVANGGLGEVHRIETDRRGTLRLLADGPDGPVRVRLDALSDRVVRFRVAPRGRQLARDTRYSHAPDTTWSGPTTWAVEETDEAVVARTAALTFRIDRAWPRLTITDADGAVLVDTIGLDFQNGQIVHQTALAPADRLLGLGDKALALDRRGHRLDMWNTDAFKYQRGPDPLYKSIPFVLRIGEDASVGLFYDDTHRTHFDLGASLDDRMAFASPWGVLDLTVVSASSPLGVIEGFSRVVGKTPLLPKWSLGYHQCRYSYMNEGEVREVAREFRERQIPCDALYFDIHYMDGFRVFTWDRERFPNPQGLLSDLQADGFRSVVIVDPGVKADDPDYDVYRQGEALDAYVRYPNADGTPGEIAKGEVWPGLCAFPDYTRADVRAWWGQLHDELVAQGVDGIWNDMNEPALFEVAHVEGTMDAEGAVGTLPDHALHGLDGRGGTHAEAHNLYGMQMQRATFEGLRRLAPERRPFTITRAAYAGSQRFGTGWTGDNTASWDHLRLAIQTCLSLGVSGMPFTGADVGGFVGTPSGELVARWTQLGALTPLFRNHSAVDTPRQEPWLFGDEVERVCREAIELRMRLLPALYTALWQAAEHGTPIMRPLPILFPDDETVRRTSPLGFMVGDSVLAHPVVEEGQTEREVYLPPSGAGWFDFWTGQHTPGRTTVWTETPLGHLPLYVRAGSVLPLGPVRASSAAPAERVELHVYPAPGRWTSELYEDAGDGWGFQTGDRWHARFDGSDDGQTLGVELATEGHHQPEWTGFDVVVHGLGAAPSSVRAGGEAIPFDWDGGAVRFPLAVGDGFELVR